MAQTEIPRLDDDALRAIADGIAGADPCALLPDGDRRRWGLVVRTPAYEAWVIAWPQGAGLAMHDHRGSRAAVSVVRGELRERFVDASRVSVQTRRLLPGVLVVLPADHIHEVANVGLIEAVSVHVYSPPCDDVDFRDDPELDLARVPAPLAVAADA
jgi:hypothetical protein